ncbi:MAG TPA: fibronectin type III domain-containing protein [Terriglobales bacterium]|nr:fibronectin type III domain-containing protein [Terriglobales bacterium]
MIDAEVVTGAPGAPRMIAVTPVDGAAVVSWQPPAEGPSVTRYEVTPVYGWTPLRERMVMADGSAASALVRGLLNGTTYTVRVTACHGELAGQTGTSPPFEPNPPPGPPVSVAAAAGEQSASVSWGRPLSGGPIERYRVMASPNGVEPVVVPATQTSVLMTGLRNRTRYTFAVAGVNGAGENVSSPSNPVWPGDDVPRYLFPLEVTYLLLLNAIAFLYALHYQPIVIGGVSVPALRDVLPPTVAGVPVSIPWFGALGAVLIGLYGIFDHSHRDWQRGLNTWHVARPFTGAALGTVGFILFASVIRATGITPQPAEGVGKLVYFGVAFVVGFREETFRQLIKRVADLIVGPGQGTTLVAPRPPLPPVFPPPPAAPAPARAAAAAPGTALVEPGLSPTAADGR